MNILSKILKELAQDFKMPEIIEQNLFRRLFPSKKTKEKMISEKTKNGTNND